MPDAAILASDRESRARATSSRVLPLEGRGVYVERDGRTLLDGIDLTLDGTALTVIMGPNGAGKSLLLRVLANLVSPERGIVRWGGRAPDRARLPRIGFVFQQPVMLRRSVIQNVKFALAAANVAGSRREERAREMLELASLTALARAPARVLSGGEQQRLAVVRALATDPEVLLLDEPTSSLDPASTLAIERLLGEARTRLTKVVLITHEVRQARRLADEIVFVHRGRIVERQSASTFFDAPASEPARAFLDGRIDL